MRHWRLEPAHDLGLALSERMRSERRESGFIETAAHLAWWAAVGGYLKTIHRLRVEGREHLPEDGPFVLVSNHQSHLDALVLASQLPWRLRVRTYPIAAADTFFESPLKSAFAAAAINALPMSRGRAGVHALQTLRDRLANERCIYILFPEGTRSRDGLMGPFKPGVGMFLAGTSVPAVPCHLIGTFEALAPRRHVPRPVRITLRIGKPMTFEQMANLREGWAQIAERLERAVRGLAELDS
ncbi:MAG TPA: lysophospholipid acyltransferase family protein [Tepidisphaeraceae bacterium]|nr:lysophospholipid acyltransferase family protein [Tepidisphaeraceae bacterium]